MVNVGAILPVTLFPMIKGPKRKDKFSSVEDSSVRASISFPPELYDALEEIARQKKVSLAWVVRDAVEQYVAAKWPLFSVIDRRVRS